jgi:DNA repair exonuclease SbcCD nuclease subunit
MRIEAKRAFIISDTHFGARSNSIEWLDMMKEWFYSDFIPKVKEVYQPGDILIHCGDVFDNRQSVNLLVLHEGIHLFEELSSIFTDGIFVIAGNHDVMRKSSNDVSSLDVLKYIPRVHIIKEPIVAEFPDTRALFMPWRTNDEEEKKCIAEYEAHNCHYMFCHTNIRNLKFDNSRDVEEGLNLSELTRFRRVYSGHIHWGQQRGNVIMVGNPYQMTRSDAGNKKGWYLLDLSSGEEKFQENEFSPKFIRVHLNRFLNSSLSELKSICQNNRVDLLVPSDYLLRYQINPIIDELSSITKKLEIIPFEIESSNLIDADSIESESTFNIFGLCQKYVESMKSIDSVSKDRVINKINQLYVDIVKEER